MKKGFLIVWFIITFLYFLQFASTDVFSVNSGGDEGLIINPDEYLEGFFFQENEVPVMSSVLLSSVPLGTNTTTENLTVTYSSSDGDGDALTNISDWRVGGVSIAVLNMPFDTKLNSTTANATYDYSIFKNNGTLGGGNISRMPVWNSSGKIGGAYTFDGVNDDIIINDSNSLSFTDGSGNDNPFSVSFWVKPSSTGNQWFINKRGANTATQTEWQVYLYTGLLGVSCFNGGAQTVYIGATQTNPFGLNQWNYVTVTYNGNENESGLNIYVNGTLQSSTKSASGAYSGMSNTASNVTIGRTGWATQFYFAGSIDEVRVYNRALSLEQITADYLAGVAGHSAETLVSQETSVGETWTVAMTANDKWYDSITVLSNNLTIVNNAPSTPAPLLTSTNGRNETDADLNCSFNVFDVDSSFVNVTVNWLKDSTSQINLTYNNVANGTSSYSILDKNNLTLGDIWKCSVRFYDGYNYSAWGDSNTLTIIDITAPNITIISPQPINYTTLNVTFNVLLNENGSLCYYNWDYTGNISMTKLNNTYFWALNESFGPGEHNVTFYCNDTINNWGTNYTNFTINNEAAISILLSANLSWSVFWNVTSIPADDLDADGNNLNGYTDYYINVSATNTLVDIYVRADGDLHTDGLETLGLENENYTVSLSDPNVTGIPKVTMTTNYVLIADGIGDNSVVYMKFYLDAPPGQGAGAYYNNLDFKAVRDGQSP